MLRGKVSGLFTVMGMSILAAGCMPKMTIEDMKAMRPKRPAELDRLNVFVGKWKAAGECTMAGVDEKMSFSGTGEAKWEGDGWILMNRGTMSMGELGEMQGYEMWSYDVKSGKYRIAWADTMGGFGVGTAKYNEKDNSFHSKVTNYTPFGKTSGVTGQVEFGQSWAG